MKQLNMDLKAVGEKRLLQLNELDEFSMEAYENSKLYKERTKKWYDLHIQRRESEVGLKVLLYNSKLMLFPGKLRSRWLGPYTVTKVLPYRDIEVSHETKGTFRVNEQMLKHHWSVDFSKKKSIVIGCEHSLISRHNIVFQKFSRVKIIDSEIELHVVINAYGNLGNNPYQSN
ncbi:uncharacterized protein LOC111366790 [Olea europaea var. sylvestris]|uniref:uncharacterized protein LOC111366790 n=1 Tax=Olea europaea var. sylvestris TaxID=158386 RepID=UPI000C1D1B33|nr:uncharacterized protein LOC111366790 [Olea europaea var. sylvestris]